MLLLTLRGTPTIYFGDEIGMPDGDVPEDRIQDPQALNLDDPSFSRDPQRTPMRWDDSENGGFTNGEPWLPVGEEAGATVEAQRDDPDSMLSLHRRLLDLRRSEPALQIGDYATAGIEGDAFAFVREHEGRRFLTALNLGDEPAALRPERELRGRVMVGTNRKREGDFVDEAVELAPNEGIVLLLQR